MAETYDFNGADCTYSVTVLQTIEAGGHSFYAPSEIITSQMSPLTITFHYPSLTLATLEFLGPTIIFVCCPAAICSKDRLKPGLAETEVAGQQCKLRLPKCANHCIVLPTELVATTVLPVRMTPY